MDYNARHSYLGCRSAGFYVIDLPPCHCLPGSLSRYLEVSRREGHDALATALVKLYIFYKITLSCLVQVSQSSEALQHLNKPSIDINNPHFPNTSLTFGLSLLAVNISSKIKHKNPQSWAPFQQSFSFSLPSSVSSLDFDIHRSKLTFSSSSHRCMGSSRMWNG